MICSDIAQLNSLLYNLLYIIILVPLSVPFINSTTDEDFIHYEIDLSNITWRGYDRSIELWYQQESELDEADIEEALWNETKYVLTQIFP